MTRTELDNIFPPTFVEETEYGKANLIPGIRERNFIRRMTADEYNIYKLICDNIK
jgi:hypothetical protein